MHNPNLIIPEKPRLKDSLLQKLGCIRQNCQGQNKMKISETRTPQIKGDGEITVKCFDFGLDQEKNSYKRQHWQNSSCKIAITKWHYGHNLKMDYDLDNNVIWTLKFLILITSLWLYKRISLLWENTY